MFYRYETHMHTSEGSACATSTGAEMARAHKAAGYTGIFITDHFFNGNTAVPRDLPWRQRVEQFCLGYENAKEEGDKIGLQVFFGFEYAYQGAEFLIYNLDKQWLLTHEDIHLMDTRQVLNLIRQDGGFAVQAHPFRERGYIDHFQLYPRDIDAVEGINAAHEGEAGDKMNQRALTYAKMFDLPATSGSDTHSAEHLHGGGVMFKEKLQTPLDYLRLLRSGKFTLMTGEKSG